MYRRSYDFEFKQESHSVQENRSRFSTTYPLYKEYHAPPPPTLHKVVNHPSYHHEPVSDDDEDHGHDHMAVNNNSLWNHLDESNRIPRDGNHDWCGTRQANNNNNHGQNKNKYIGGILRPPLGLVSRHPSHEYPKHRPSIDQGRYGDAYSRVNHNKNRGIEDEYDDHVGGVVVGDGEELDSLIKRLKGDGLVKKIEVIEYQRKTYRGARQEWRVFSGSEPPSKYNSSTTTNNNQYSANGYPNNHKASWVKRF